MHKQIYFVGLFFWWGYVGWLAVWAGESKNPLATVASCGQMPNLDEQPSSNGAVQVEEGLGAVQLCLYVHTVERWMSGGRNHMQENPFGGDQWLG